MKAMEKKLKDFAKTIYLILSVKVKYSVIFMANSYKKFLITGASRGIGKSIALKLLKHNFKVIGISRKHTIKNLNYILLLD